MRLKELRKSRNLTQQDVARFLGIPHKTYQNYEREVRDVDTTILCKLADLYGVSLDALFGRQAENKPSELSNDEVLLVGFYRRIADEDKQTFMNNAQLFAIAGDAKKLTFALITCFPESSIAANAASSCMARHAATAPANTISGTAAQRSERPAQAFTGKKN